MRCEDLAAQLTEFMEGNLPDDVEQAALEHLASCGACEQVLVDTEATVALVAEHGRAGIGSEVKRRLLDGIVADVRRSSAD